MYWLMGISHIPVTTFPEEGPTFLHRKTCGGARLPGVQIFYDTIHPQPAGVAERDAIRRAPEVDM